MILNNQNYRKFRKGIGKYSLCEKYKNLTGAWYAPSFIDWTKQGFDWLEKLEIGAKLAISFRIQPLNVIKQILVMALASASEQTLNYHHELRRFLLNREAQYLPPKYLVHTYFNKDSQPRFASDMVITKIDSGSMSYVEAEIALPSFGYSITKSIKKRPSIPEIEELCDIIWLSNFESHITETVYLKISLRETHEPFPLDYRTKKEVDEHHRKMGIKK